jgi:GNAT superfamily N-acetyltransferase
MVNIRTFRPADADAVRALFARGQLDFAEGTPLEADVRRYIEHSLAADLADIPANYVERPRSAFWVAEQGSIIKGTVGIQQVDDSEAELRRMSVAGDIRRQGLGRRLLETVEEFCRREGYSRIALSTVIHLEPAVKMYIAHGFEATRQEPYGPMTVQYFVKQL